MNEKDLRKRCDELFAEMEQTCSVIERVKFGEYFELRNRLLKEMETRLEKAETAIQHACHALANGPVDGAGEFNRSGEPAELLECYIKVWTERYEEARERAECAGAWWELVTKLHHLLGIEYHTTTNELVSIVRSRLDRGVEVQAEVAAMRKKLKHMGDQCKRSLWNPHDCWLYVDRVLNENPAGRAFLDRLRKAEERTENTLSAEHELSNAYLRLRTILRAFDTPEAPTGQQVWRHTEAKASALWKQLEEAQAAVAEMTELLRQVPSPPFPWRREAGDYQRWDEGQKRALANQAGRIFLDRLRKAERERNELRERVDSMVENIYGMPSECKFLGAKTCPHMKKAEERAEKAEWDSVAVERTVKEIEQTQTPLRDEEELHEWIERNEDEWTKTLAKQAALTEKAEARADKAEHVLRLSGDMREFEELIESSEKAEAHEKELEAQLRGDVRLDCEQENAVLYRRIKELEAALKEDRTRLLKERDLAEAEVERLRTENEALVTMNAQPDPVLHEVSEEEKERFRAEVRNFKAEQAIITGEAREFLMENVPDESFDTNGVCAAVIDAVEHIRDEDMLQSVYNLLADRRRIIEDARQEVKHVEAEAENRSTLQERFKRALKRAEESPDYWVERVCIEIGERYATKAEVRELADMVYELCGPLLVCLDHALGFYRPKSGAQNPHKTTVFTTRDRASSLKHSKPREQLDDPPTRDDVAVPASGEADSYYIKRKRDDVPPDAGQMPIPKADPGSVKRLLDAAQRDSDDVPPVEREGAGDEAE